MGIQINGQTDNISATDGSLTISGADLPNVTNLNATGIVTAGSGLHVTGGSVGIGTDNPQVKLEIRSSADAPTLTWNGSGQTIIGDTANQLAIGRVNSNPFGLYLQGRASNSAARGILLNPVGGNVGIGTDNPQAVLHAYHPTSNTIINVESGDAGAVLNLIDPSQRSSIEQNGTTLKISSDTGAEFASSDIRLQVDGGTVMRAESTGNVKIDNGNLVFSTSGTGIDFSATSNGSGTTDSELLDDYEEGNFTPVFNNTISGITYTNQYGKYTKIGNRLIFNVFLTWSTNTVSPSSTHVYISGFPFTAPDSLASYGAASFTSNRLTIGAAGISFQVSPTQPNIYIYNQNSGSDKTNFTFSSMASSGEIICQGQYQTS